MYPDVFKRGTIRDRAGYIARQLQVEEEYNLVRGLPHRPYMEGLKGKVFFYQVDPGQAAYHDIMAEKRRFLERIGKGGEGYWITPRGQTLYNFKMAIRYEDKEAASRYFVEYFALGGTKEGFKRGLESLHPLYGLSRAEQAAFYISLSKEDRRWLKSAVRFIRKLKVGSLVGTGLITLLIKILLDKLLLDAFSIVS